MRFLTIAFTLLFISTFSFAQSDCQPYIPMSVGTTWEITDYNKKGKVTGRIAYELLSLEEEGTSSTFSIQSIVYDKDDKEIMRNVHTAICKDGKFEVEMGYKMNQGNLQGMNGMDATIDASSLEIPDMNASVGTQLNDASLKMTLGGDGGMGLSIVVLVSNRKVEAREKITTPAGEFDCILLSQDVSTKMLMEIKGTSKEWYAANIGLVRSESYSKRGKLLSYSELTKLDIKQ